MKNPLGLLVWLLVIGGVINVFVSNPTISYEDRKEMTEAEEAYLNGEKAKTIGERNAAFNLALKNYKTLEEAFHPTSGNGILYFDIANTYFQLSQYPYAVLYYHRALKLQPRNEKLLSYIRLSEEKLGFTEVKNPSLFDHISFFYPFFSLPEKLQLFSIFTLAAVLFFSLLIWTEKKVFRHLAFCFSFLSFGLFVVLGYTHYFSPTEAIAIQSVSLYRDAGFQYAKAAEEPLLSGKKVEILEILDHGTWLKIRTSDGTLGYAPSEAMRVI